MFFDTKSHYTILSNYVAIFKVDAEMSEIFTDFSRKKSQKNSAHWLQWVRNYWYCRFNPKLVMFLQGVYIHNLVVNLEWTGGAAMGTTDVCNGVQVKGHKVRGLLPSPFRWKACCPITSVKISPPPPKGIIVQVRFKISPPFLKVMRHKGNSKLEFWPPPAPSVKSSNMFNYGM